ncbi:MAG: hypothetical protein GTN73_04305, partial [Candidatus Aminicenantes bacterium]|nr:hypothetical protein [Candidatus Aminicenantes bacterium]
MERPDYDENEIELIDYLNVLWKRKWLIIIPTFFLVVLAGVISFLLPPKWEIDSIIVPSKFLIQTEQGEFEEVVVVDPNQIAGQINEKSYDHLIAAELNLDIKEFPKLKADNLRDTKLVRVSIKEKDVEKAKLILYSLFNHLKRDLDKKIDVEIKGLDTQVESKKNVINSKEIEIKDKENAIKLRKLLIEDRKNEIKTKQNRIKDKENVIKTKENAIKLKENAIKLKNLNIDSKEIDKKNIEEEINTLQNKLKISLERENAIIEEMKEVKNRVDKIEEEQRKVLKEGSDKNALSILLYSNEIQNNLRYYNTLDEKLSSEKITQENINLTIEEKKAAIKQIDNQIEQIRTQIDDIKTAIDDIRTQIDDIKTQIDDIHTQIDNINNEIGKINYEIDTIKNGIIIKKNEIENVRNEITYFQERKARIDYTQLIKEPTSSLYPVSPKKKLNVLIAGILG